MTAPERCATVVAVMMGMGHLRAAYPLRHFANDGVLIYGSKRTTPPGEYRIWRRIRKSYYFFSKAGEIPLIGTLLLKVLVWLQSIEPYYPRPVPARVIGYLERQIKRRGLCRKCSQRSRRAASPIRFGL